MSRLRIIAGLSGAGLLFALGCETSMGLSPGYAIPLLEVKGPSISRRVVLIADNQLHHLYGQPVWIQSGLTNRVVNVAIRPLQLDVWGPELLREIIGKYARRELVIHLGDALDVACTTEWERFVAIMSGARRGGWLMAPGNHDAYYFGNGHFMKSEWKKACEDGLDDGGQPQGAPLTKDRFVDAYLTALSDQPSHGFSRSTSETTWTASKSDTALRKIEWKIDEHSPWRSYVVQKLDLAKTGELPVTTILLDTSQYHHRPSLVPIPGWRVNAGMTGDLGRDQIEVVDQWLENRPPGELLLLMGHHPYEGLTSNARAAIDRWRQGGPTVLVTAHKHTAQYFVHDDDGVSWLEVNLGSTTDWPPQLRTLQVAISSAPPGYALRLHGKLLQENFIGKSICEPEWEVPADESDFYISYNEITTAEPIATKIILMDTVLRSHDWQLRHVKSSSDNTSWPDGTSSDCEVRLRIQGAMGEGATLDEKLDLLRALDRFDRERTPVDKFIRDSFRLCQAFLASKYDSTGARVPQPYDSYIVVPKE